MSPSLKQRFFTKQTRLIGIMTHDLVMIWLCWQGLHTLRYLNLEQEWQWYLQPLSVDFLLVLGIQAAIFQGIGLYRGRWRFASITDLAHILKASLIGLCAILVALFIYNRLEGVPRTVLILWPLGLTALLGNSRLLYRLWSDRHLVRVSSGNSQRVLILGAGLAAESLLKDFQRSGTYQVVGLLDDDPRLEGSKLLGITVQGGLDKVATIAEKTRATLLVIAMPSLDMLSMQRVVGLCESTGLPFKTVPRLIDLIDGQVQLGQLKDIAIEDLLGREPIQPDWQRIHNWLDGRTILVTGAGGSIGSELCRQCARHGIKKLILLEISEFLLLGIGDELRQKYPDLVLEYILGDCGDADLLDYVLKTHRPDTVFHAAAYKQVPLLETQLRAAVRNNVLATECVARASLKHGVDHFVLVSTDKAVEPANALGASKRYAEMICQRLNEQSLNQHARTRFVTVRFGNVLDSVGSVVPLFREQIRQGGPVTVTDPEVTRYFMTIPEACLLILQAVTVSTRGAVYMLEMGQPILIRVLAEQMIRLAGKRLGSDIAISYTGLRPGEKLHESLLYSHENTRPTAHPKVLEAITAQLPPGQVLSNIPKLRQAVADMDSPTLLAILHAAIPDYKSPPVACTAPKPAAVSNVTALPRKKVMAH